MNLSGFKQYPVIKRLAGRFRRGCVPGFRCLREPLIVFQRKLRVNRQPHGFTGCSSGKLHGKFHALRTFRARCDVDRILLGR